METLFTTLKEELQLADKKTEYILEIIKSIIETKTINLEAISQVINPNNKPESNYRMLQRFFKDFSFVFTHLAKILISYAPEKDRILIIDRTQWKDNNIFFLAVMYQNIAVPVLWDTLDKKGSTNTLERISLIEDYVNIFGKENINYLVADREFIGKDWFKWLNTSGIKFLIRLKSNFLIEQGIKHKKKVKGTFRYYHSKEMVAKLFGIELKIMGKRVNKKDLLIVATNADEFALDDYSNRWSIECMFSCFKKKGFNLESTKMTAGYKIDKLIALVSLAYCCCITVGIHYKYKDSTFRKDLGYRTKSIFKIGLQRLSNTIRNPLFSKDLFTLTFLSYSLQNLYPNFSVVE